MPYIQWAKLDIRKLIDGVRSCIYCLNKNAGRNWVFASFSDDLVSLSMQRHFSNFKFQISYFKFQISYVKLWNINGLTPLGCRHDRNLKIWIWDKNSVLLSRDWNFCEDIINLKPLISISNVDTFNLRIKAWSFN